MLSLFLNGYSHNINVQVGPVFQLENLENLQLVLPEQGEPQIVIPETGLTFKILELEL